MANRILKSQSVWETCLISYACKRKHQSHLSVGKNEDDIQVKYVVDEDVIRKTVMNLPEVKDGTAPENAKVLMDFAGDFYTIAEKEGTQHDTEKLI